MGNVLRFGLAVWISITLNSPVTFHFKRLRCGRQFRAGCTYVGRTKALANLLIDAAIWVNGHRFNSDVVVFGGYVALHCPL